MNLSSTGNMWIAAKIRQRRRQLLVHSYIYYELDMNIVDDATWARWAKELVELQEKYPVESRSIEYYEAFKDFDGSTGAFLPLQDPWVKYKAEQLLAIKGYLS